MFNSIPLLLPLVAIYFVLALIAPSTLDSALFGLGLPSGAPFTLRGGELLAALGLVLLYFEVLKSTRSAESSVLDHGLSLLLFIVSLILFLVFPPAGTATFFLILVMTLLDVVAGFTVTIASARRDIGVEGMR
jgi:hypothetical protein